MILLGAIVVVAIGSRTGAAAPGLDAKPVVQYFSDQVMVRPFYYK